MPGARSVHRESRDTAVRMVRDEPGFGVCRRMRLCRRVKRWMACAKRNHEYFFDWKVSSENESMLTRQNGYRIAEQIATEIVNINKKQKIMMIQDESDDEDGDDEDDDYATKKQETAND